MENCTIGYVNKKFETMPESLCGAYAWQHFPAERQIDLNFSLLLVV